MAERFRQRGTPVVLGGPHVTLMPDEAQAHTDVIFVGEAESDWSQFFREFETGRHRRRYCSAEPPSLDDAPMARKDLFHRRDHTAGVLFARGGICCGGSPCRAVIRIYAIDRRYQRNHVRSRTFTES
jgi:radical SAM superfamily enzyme YgiQ (UPF0313 family)